MKFTRDLGFVLLAAVAGMFAATPVPPWSAKVELFSVATAFLIFICLLFLPQLRVRRTVLGIFIGIVPLLRVLAEMTWDVVPNYMPRSFFFLTNVMGADGEGSYNSNTYQVFLVLLGIAFICAIVMPPNRSAQSREPSAAAGL
jgi:glucan phosphoethanolaminetransferase (alkaline phosphatase superfamily)